MTAYCPSSITLVLKIQRAIKELDEKKNAALHKAYAQVEMHRRLNYMFTCFYPYPAILTLVIPSNPLYILYLSVSFCFRPIPTGHAGLWLNFFHFAARSHCQTCACRRQRPACGSGGESWIWEIVEGEPYGVERWATVSILFYVCGYMFVDNCMHMR